jgi:hypothetical protein
MYGDRVVWLPIIKNAFGKYIAFHFFIRGSYDDYGRVEEIDDTPSAKSMVEHFQYMEEKGDLVFVGESRTNGSNKIDTIENLVKHVERGRITSKTTSIVIENEDRVPSMIKKTVPIEYVMIHEKLFDEVLGDIASRSHSFGSKKTFEEAIYEDIDNIPEYLKQAKEVWGPRGVDMEENIDFEIYMTRVYRSRAKRRLEDLTTKQTLGLCAKELMADNPSKWVRKSIVDLVLFGSSLHLMRKSLHPTSEKGSQCQETTLHCIVGQYAMDLCKGIFTEYEKENVIEENESSISHGREGIYF